MVTKLGESVRAGRVPFWAGASALFLANCLLSLARSEWMLASLQAMTAILAVLAAVEDWASRRHPAGVGTTDDSSG
jgi:hypothetical protein